MQSPEAICVKAATRRRSPARPANGRLEVWGKVHSRAGWKSGTGSGGGSLSPLAKWQARAATSTCPDREKIRACPRGGARGRGAARPMHQGQSTSAAHPGPFLFRSCRDLSSGPSADIADSSVFRPGIAGCNFLPLSKYIRFLLFPCGLTCRTQRAFTGLQLLQCLLGGFMPLLLLQQEIELPARCPVG